MHLCIYAGTNMHAMRTWKQKRNARARMHARARAYAIILQVIFRASIRAHEPARRILRAPRRALPCVPAQCSV